LCKTLYGVVQQPFSLYVMVKVTTKPHTAMTVAGQLDLCTLLIPSYMVCALVTSVGRTSTVGMT